MANKTKIYLRDLRRLVVATVAPPMAFLSVAWLIGAPKLVVIANVAAVAWMLLATAMFSLLLLTPKRPGSDNDRRRRPSGRTA